MPRRNRPPKPRRRVAGEEDEERPLAPDVIVGSPPGWQVRAIQPAKALKAYRCPGCNQEILPGTAHVVAWREDDADNRRHWHKGCWDTNRRRMR